MFYNSSNALQGLIYSEIYYFVRKLVFSPTISSALWVV